MLKAFLMHASVGVCAIACTESVRIPESPRPNTPIVQPTSSTTLTPGHYARSEVVSILEQGPAWLLRRVLVEESINKENKFVGWKVLALPDSWSNIDLKVGDIVTHVNNSTLERPENLWDVWEKLNQQNEVRISVVRSGTNKDLVLYIDGPASKTVASKPKLREPTHETRVIEADDSL